MTVLCEEGIGNLPSGMKIRVIDTPGILDTKQRDVKREITKCIALLEPGPHAFIIVLQPNRATEEEKQVIKDLTEYFGDDEFLAYTLIVMVRRNEIRDDNEELIDIHEFMNTMAADEVKSLYTQCGKRIVAVENYASKSEKQQYAQQIVDEISTMDGYYSHHYFDLRRELEIKKDELATLQNAMQEEARKRNRTICSIL